MLFHTYPFLMFFCVVFSVYWTLGNHRARMGWLLGASCFFYMSWNPWLITLILFSASVDYLVALRLPQVRSTRLRRGMLFGSISINLGLLAFFKYTNFLLDTVNPGLNLLGIGLRAPLANLILPLGISFYTFETISYIVDVYLGRQRPVRNLLDYALYIMFFPHLIAGPIVRANEFLPQLARPKRWSWPRLQLGTRIFLLGLFKKAVIADQLAPIVDVVFDKPGTFSSSAIWLAVLCYAVQIYCDFSGYSDMAIGIAHTLGFKLPVNFLSPYLAADVTEFWQRWHITLSTWLRDYLYIPLGGNRHGSWATYRNLILTMVLGGLWHGANWTFVLWGLYHGLLLALHRAIPKPRWFANPSLRPVFVAGTFLSVCVGWIFFRAQSTGQATAILGRLLLPRTGIELTAIATAIGFSCLGVLLAGHLLPRLMDLKGFAQKLPAPVLGAALASVMFLVQLLIPEESKAFIYFQF